MLLSPWLSLVGTEWCFLQFIPLSPGAQSTRKVDSWGPEKPSGSCPAQLRGVLQKQSFCSYICPPLPIRVWYPLIPGNSEGGTFHWGREKNSGSTHLSVRAHCLISSWHLCPSSRQPCGLGGSLAPQGPQEACTSRMQHRTLCLAAAGTRGPY